MALLEQVAEFMRRKALPALPGVVAVSGGPDSVALAHLLTTLWREARIAPVTLAHVNHQLRGADSDDDEALVRSLPTAWNTPQLVVASQRVDVARIAKDAGDNLENAARRARYHWLAEIAHQTGAGWIATGHTADDQAETVLHHFLRGSGLQGLAGMPQRRCLAPGIDLIRPLLSLRRADVMAYLHEQQLAYRHDASNDDLSFTRNRLRADLLPRLQRDYNPALVEVLSRTGRQLREIQDELSRQASELLAQVERPRAGPMIVLQRATLAATAPVLVRELLRLVWQREGWPMGEMGFVDWDRATALTRGETSGQDFPGGVRLRCGANVIQIDRGL